MASNLDQSWLLTAPRATEFKRRQVAGFDDEGGSAAAAANNPPIPPDMLDPADMEGQIPLAWDDWIYMVQKRETPVLLEASRLLLGGLNNKGDYQAFMLAVGQARAYLQEQLETNWGSGAFLAHQWQPLEGGVELPKYHNRQIREMLLRKLGPWGLTIHRHTYNNYLYVQRDDYIERHPVLRLAANLQAYASEWARQNKWMTELVYGLANHDIGAGVPEGDMLALENYLFIMQRFFNTSYVESWKKLTPICAALLVKRASNDFDNVEPYEQLVKRVSEMFDLYLDVHEAGAMLAVGAVGGDEEIIHQRRQKTPRRVIDFRSRSMKAWNFLELFKIVVSTPGGSSQPLIIDNLEFIVNSLKKLEEDEDNGRVLRDLLQIDIETNTQFLDRVLRDNKNFMDQWRHVTADNVGPFSKPLRKDAESEELILSSPGLTRMFNSPIASPEPGSPTVYTPKARAQRAALSLKEHEMKQALAKVTPVVRSNQAHMATLFSPGQENFVEAIRMFVEASSTYTVLSSYQKLKNMRLVDAGYETESDNEEEDEEGEYKGKEPLAQENEDEDEDEDELSDDTDYTDTIAAEELSDLHWLDKSIMELKRLPAEDLVIGISSEDDYVLFEERFIKRMKGIVRLQQEEQYKVAGSVVAQQEIDDAFGRCLSRVKAILKRVITFNKFEGDVVGADNERQRLDEEHRELTDEAVVDKIDELKTKLRKKLVKAASSQDRKLLDNIQQLRKKIRRLEDYQSRKQLVHLSESSSSAPEEVLNLPYTSKIRGETNLVMEVAQSIFSFGIELFNNYEHDMIARSCPVELYNVFNPATGKRNDQIPRLLQSPNKPQWHKSEDPNHVQAQVLMMAVRFCLLTSDQFLQFYGLKAYYLQRLKEGASTEQRRRMVFEIFTTTLKLMKTNCQELYEREPQRWADFQPAYFTEAARAYPIELVIFEGLWDSFSLMCPQFSRKQQQQDDPSTKLHPLVKWALRVKYEHQPKWDSDTQQRCYEPMVRDNTCAGYIYCHARVLLPRLITIAPELIENRTVRRWLTYQDCSTFLRYNEVKIPVIGHYVKGNPKTHDAKLVVPADVIRHTGMDYRPLQLPTMGEFYDTTQITKSWAGRIISLSLTLTRSDKTLWMRTCPPIPIWKTRLMAQLMWLIDLSYLSETSTWREQLKASLGLSKEEAESAASIKHTLRRLIEFSHDACFLVYIRALEQAMYEFAFDSQISSEWLRQAMYDNVTLEMKKDADDSRSPEKRTGITHENTQRLLDSVEEMDLDSDLQSTRSNMKKLGGEKEQEFVKDRELYERNKSVAETYMVRIQRLYQWLVKLPDVQQFASLWKPNQAAAADPDKLDEAARAIDNLMLEHFSGTKDRADSYRAKHGLTDELVMTEDIRNSKWRQYVQMSQQLLQLQDFPEETASTALDVLLRVFITQRYDVNAGIKRKKNSDNLLLLGYKIRQFLTLLSDMVINEESVLHRIMSNEQAPQRLSRRLKQFTTKHRDAETLKGSEAFEEAERSKMAALEADDPLFVRDEINTDEDVRAIQANIDRIRAENIAAAEAKRLPAIVTSPEISYRKNPPVVATPIAVAPAPAPAARKPPPPIKKKKSLIGGDTDTCLYKMAEWLGQEQIVYDAGETLKILRYMQLFMVPHTGPKSEGLIALTSSAA